LQCNDAVEGNGHVPNGQRIIFYRDHLNELARAIADGAKVKGFHAWSFLDNFEWMDGYSQRFGLVFVDRENLRRVVKDSGYWYADVIAQKRA
jgi:beta-glucosidase